MGMKKELYTLGMLTIGFLAILTAVMIIVYVPGQAADQVSSETVNVDLDGNKIEQEMRMPEIQVEELI